MTSKQLPEPQRRDAGLRKALALPDGPFKLYVWLWLNAQLDTGIVETSQGDLAQSLNKSRGAIRANLRILEEAGVCRTKFQNSPVSPGWIQIADDYWPYARVDSETEDSELRSYLEQVRTMLRERACIRSTFSAADDLLAREWYTRGVPLERVGQAILLGCARKYVSWRNGAPRAPIVSLRYFEEIVAELEHQQPQPDYWDYTHQRIERMEKLLRKKEASVVDEQESPGVAKPQKRAVPRYRPRADR
jgi:DNA-binding Lrp family transcriptional regulator